MNAGGLGSSRHLRWSIGTFRGQIKREKTSSSVSTPHQRERELVTLQRHFGVPFGTDYRALCAGQRHNASNLETSVAHPADAIGAAEIEAASSFDEHV
jgi:hypothetical protein